MSFNNKHIECSKCKGTLEYGGVFEDGSYFCSKCFTEKNGPITKKSNLFKKTNDNEFTTIDHTFSKPNGLSPEANKSLDKLIKKLRE